MRAPECTECGACCLAESEYGDLILELTPDEARYFKRLIPSAVYMEDGKYYLGSDETRPGKPCFLFDGEVGGKCACLDWDNRPQQCRDFKRGSRDCRVAIKTHTIGSINE